MKRTAWIVLVMGLLAASSYALLVAIPQYALHPARSLLSTSPADVDLAFEDFIISPQDSDLQLAGWWMPAEKPRATLVFIHGGGSNRHSHFFGSLNFYRAMVNQGIAVAAIDLRNHGMSGSDAHGLQFGRTEMYDALAAIDWAHQKTPGLPLFAMGISMGGATLIQAAYHGAELDGLILLDSLLDTFDTFKRGATAKTGLPSALFTPSAWAATNFHGLPTGEEQTLERAVTLQLPILAMQDPDDPVTRAPHSRELARRNPNVTLWTAPTIDSEHPDLAWKGGWGSHVSAFEFYPQETVDHIIGFMTGTPCLDCTERQAQVK
jgi:pimeloyl-ACP methyl ester carboxylesterase